MADLILLIALWIGAGILTVRFIRKDSKMTQKEQMQTVGLWPMYWVIFGYEILKTKVDDWTK